MGDFVLDRNFVRVLEKVLSRQIEDMLEILGRDPQFVAAMGAAELSKRLPYDPDK